MQKVIINPGFGGKENGTVSGNIIEKDYNLEISKIIYDRLRALGINAYLVRDDDKTLNDEERLEIIESYIENDDDIIILTNILASGNDQGAEIIYALRNRDTLASEISLNIENIGQNILKYYQLRDPNNTSMDFYSIIKDTKDYESIIVSYGYPENQNDNLFLENNLDNLGIAVANALYDYLKKENIYTVKNGDNLYLIANKFNTSAEEIKNLNGLTSNNLTIGQELIIPKLKEIEIEKDDNNNFFYYVVKQQDNLYKIARTFNTTINAIKEINNLENDNLKVAEILKIPTKVTTSDEGNYIIYTVKSGDSLYAIAKNFQTSVNEIKNINGLNTNNLAIGQILKIPR